VNVLIKFVYWVCMLGRGICWFFLPYIDVSVVLAYGYMVYCLRVSFLPRGLPWNTIFVSIEVYSRLYIGILDV
jgi:hypothetical protein